jgi:hypothetical protein
LKALDTDLTKQIQGFVKKTTSLESPVWLMKLREQLARFETIDEAHLSDKQSLEQRSTESGFQAAAAAQTQKVQTLSRPVSPIRISCGPISPQLQCSNPSFGAVKSDDLNSQLTWNLTMSSGVLSLYR